MTEEEIKELKALIKEYEIGYKESKNEGNVEDYESLKETHKLLKDTLNSIEKLQKENKELKEELDYYKQKESQEFDERDYYEE